MDLRYESVVENLMLYHNKTSRLILKSPENTARIETLHSAFPKAAFVYIHRDPKDVYYSMFNFWKTILRFYSFQTITDDQIVTNICLTYQKLISAYTEGRHLISGRLMEIGFSEFVLDSFKMVNSIVKELSLEVTFKKPHKPNFQTSFKHQEYLHKPAIDFKDVTHVTQE